MAKLPYPFSYYYKSMMEEKCPFCHGGDISTSKSGHVIWCDGYEDGTYIVEEACHTFAVDGEGQCNYCFAGNFVHRHYPEDLIMVCERCKIAINFEKKKISKTIF